MYDVDGRLLQRKVEASHLTGTRPWPDALLMDDHYTYNAKGQRLRVDDLLGDVWVGYNGLGALAWSSSQRDFTGQRSGRTWSNEGYALDALGNQVTMSREGQPDPDDPLFAWVDESARYAY